MAGPRVRTDVFDVYVFRRTGSVLELLQLRRTQEPLAGTWQPVMGHAEEGEATAAAMWRELEEETGLRPDQPELLGAWALEGLHPFFLPSRDCIMLSPRFAVEAAPGWEPTLDAEHDANRWIGEDWVSGAFMWPGQRAAIAELIELMRQPGSAAYPAQRLPPPARGR